jgi:hypothetical protein
MKPLTLAGATALAFLAFGALDAAAQQAGAELTGPAGRYMLFEGQIEGMGNEKPIRVPIMIDTAFGRTWALRQGADGDLIWQRMTLETLSNNPLTGRLAAHRFPSHLSAISLSAG